MKDRDTIRADQSAEAIEWNEAYKKLDQKVKDVMIEFRQNREEWFKTGGSQAQELARKALPLRATLLERMSVHALGGMLNCKGVIYDIQFLEDWNPREFEGELGIAPEPDTNLGLTDEDLHVKRDHIESRSSVDTQDSRSVEGTSRDHPSVETALSKDNTEGKSFLSALFTWSGNE